MDDTTRAAPSAAEGQVCAPMTPELVDAVTRWVQLLDAPEDIRPLAARIESEILYRLLRGPLGPVLRQWSPSDSATTRVREVARWICARYTEPLSIDAIAAAAHMSPASLHRHFKAATGMSPLKYQKSLRLQEARRRLVADDATAAQIAQAVGYVSATQFKPRVPQRLRPPSGSGRGPAAHATRHRRHCTGSAGVGHGKTAGRSVRRRARNGPWCCGGRAWWGDHPAFGPPGPTGHPVRDAGPVRAPPVARTEGSSPRRPARRTPARADRGGW
ncbi:AraC family transcriptional regulator [Streptomyces sp. NPDC000618]|uniref:AraC family transcriptional regulator n=1 Tax=Streptomyces sp. NPDC000618 TaxID=3154265 RepID=UPI00331D2546